MLAVGYRNLVQTRGMWANRLLIAISWAIAVQGCLVPPAISSGRTTERVAQSLIWNGDAVKNGFESGIAWCEDKLDCSASAELDPANGHGDGTAVHLSAKKSHRNSFSWLWSGKTATQGLDSTQYKVLDFWMRWKTNTPDNAPPAGLFRVSLQGPGGAIGSGVDVRYCTGPGDKDQWHRVVVPIEMLHAGGSSDFNPSNVLGINLYVADMGPQDFDLYLDDIGLGNLDEQSLAQLCRPHDTDPGSAERRVLWDGDGADSLPSGQGWATCRDTSTCTARVASIAAVGTNGSHGVHFAVHGSNGVDMGWAWNGLLTPHGTNLSAYQILTFRIKIEAQSPALLPPPGRFYVAVGDKHSLGTQPRLVEFCKPGFVNGQWHEVRVPLRELLEEAAPQFDPTNAISLWLSSSSLDSRKFDIYLDDIALEKSRPEDVSLTCKFPVVDVETLPNLPTYSCSDADAHPAPAGVIPPGWLSPSFVSRTLSDADSSPKSPLSTCRTNANMANPRLAGKLTIKFVVAPDGKVTEATPVCTSLPEPTVVECVRSAVMALEFPKSQKGGGPLHATWRLMP